MDELNPFCHGFCFYKYMLLKKRNVIEPEKLFNYMFNG